MSLTDFKKRVKAAAAVKANKPLYNSSLDHAAVLAEQMFFSAEKEVCLLSGELNPKVYGRDDVVEAATLFAADPDHKLNILLEETSADDRAGHPFFDEFFTKKRDNVKFRLAPKALQEAYKFHFMVVDSDSYRFERDKSEPTAVAAFGDSEGGENLREIFETLWKSSKVLN